MIGKSLLASAVVLISAIVGCQSGNTAEPMVGDDPPSPTTTTGDPDTAAPTSNTPTGSSCGLPSAVDAALRTKCQGCHGTTTQFSAPMSLVTYDDLTRAGQNGQKVYERVGVRIHDDQNPMPPTTTHNPLTPEESKAIDEWVAAGAPRSTETCGTEQPSTDLGPKPLECQPGETRMTVVPKVSYKVTKDVKDIYMCAGVTIPVDKSMHITAIAPHIDKKEVVHHILLLKTGTGSSETPYACGIVGAIDGALVAGWAPGGDNSILPAEAGYPVDSNMHWVVQTHYNNTKGEADYDDASGFDICVTPNKRKYDAGIIAFGSIVLAIPPHSKYKTTCSTTLPRYTDPKTGEQRDVTLFRSWPHMHNLAYGMTTTVGPVAGNGTKKTLVDVQNFSFQNQISYPANVNVAQGDVITTTCKWNNTTDRLVHWGENTEDEMCFNYTAYYPDLGLNWVSGSLNPICNTSLGD